MSAQQNLVPNGSFEDYISCPNNVAQVNYANHWFDPTYTSSDYFNSCCINNIAGIPFNMAGYKYPQNGNGMMGLAGYQGNTLSNYREYVAVKLSMELDSNVKYCLSCYISLDASWHYACNGFGGILTDDTTGIYNFFNSTIPYYPTFISNNIISDTSGWKRLEFDFINIKKNAKYLILGFFLNDASILFNINNQNFNYEGSYYYIDNVALKKCEDLLITVPNVLTPNNDGTNDVYKIIGLPKDSQLSIYNRWGNQIYYSSDYQNDWKPTDEAAGTYYYVLQTETYKGHIQLIR